MSEMGRFRFAAALLIVVLVSASAASQDEARSRMRELGLEVGVMQTGEHNDITDVAGVKVGHYTHSQPPRFNTGLTAILPHGGNLFLEKVPAAFVVGNGFGKFAGTTQVNELGELETPILLCGTLNVPRVADGLMSYMLSLPGMENVTSINPVVGETNDGYLSDIRARPMGAEEVKLAIESAASGPIPLGNVGAGTGTRCLGYKGGIGSASRVLPQKMGGWTVGVLVQTNFGGILTIGGKPIGLELNPGMEDRFRDDVEGGSIIIIVATDAPLDHRNLTRLARRTFMGLARTGSYASNGSGDYSLAFSTHESLRIKRATDPALKERTLLDNEAMSPLFLAVVEATEEAILDSMFTARTTHGHRGAAQALPVNKLMQLLK